MALRSTTGVHPDTSDRKVIELHLARATVCRDSIAVEIKAQDQGDAGAEATTSTVSTPFVLTALPRKGVTHAPSDIGAMDEATRTSLLTSIARCRNWVQSIIDDPTISFAMIAQRENLAERHVRFLAPLAYLSPRIIEAIAEGRAPADMTVQSRPQAATRLG